MAECLFCKIVSKEIPTDFVYEDENVIAFRDINPQAPTHILVIPKRVIAGVQYATHDDMDLLGHLLIAAKQIAEEQGISADGYRLAINAGDHGGQTVEHLHIHLLGGRPMQWPPG